MQHILDTFISCKHSTEAIYHIIILLLSVPFKYLIDKGSSIDYQSFQLRTPTQILIVADNLEGFKYLFDKKLINDEESEIKNLILYAFKNKSFKISQYLINEKIKSFDVNMKDDNNNTLLLLATMSDSIEMAKYVLEKGSDVNLADSKLNTPLHIACEKQNIDMVKLLLSYNPKINEKNEEYKTPLFISINKNDLDITKLLIEHKADPNLKIGYLNQTALHYAVVNSIDFLNTLISFGANVNTTDDLGNTPLHLAAKLSKGLS